MEVKATAKHVRISPRKARLVANLIKGRDVLSARSALMLLPKKASTILLKILNSAAANAEHNNRLKLEDLKVVNAFVDQGATLKRWRARAFGRSATIRKRTSHITVVVSPKSEVVKEVVAKKKDNRVKSESTKSQITKPKQTPKSKNQISKKNADKAESL